mmetsp:Transcript_28139/g.36386  ORF Transcript_28139/g.36386 Transcript_28139/m.36386 type:complete len:382 (+) Transcript_28139:1420-2565(+)
MDLLAVEQATEEFGGDYASFLCYLAREHNMDVEEAVGDFAYLITEDDVPATLEEAMRSPEAEQWGRGCDIEHQRFQDMDVYDLVELPEGKKLVKGKWVFVRKRDNNGKVTVHRCRWVAKGFGQTKGLDNNKTYAPVAKITTFRVLLSLAATQNLKIKQYDAPSAYLNGEVEEDIYVQQPIGYEVKGKEDLVCKLKKALWNNARSISMEQKVFKKKIESLGYERCTADRSLWVKKTDNGITYVLLYVDDCAVASNYPAEAKRIADELALAFRMKDLGELGYFLGMKVKREIDGSISLSQAGYLHRVLEKYNMTDCSLVAAPMSHDVLLTKLGEDEDPTDAPYRPILGSVVYAMIQTRPDLYVSQSHICLSTCQILDIDIGLH